MIPDPQARLLGIRILRQLHGFFRRFHFLGVDFQNDVAGLQARRRGSRVRFDARHEHTANVRRHIELTTCLHIEIRHTDTVKRAFVIVFIGRIAVTAIAGDRAIVRLGVVAMIASPLECKR